jgi:hypothetical protein
MASRGGLVERTLLLAPDRVARAAARRASRSDERWLLLQPRTVRGSYARHVLAAQDRDRSAEIWMLRQPDAVRESYVRDVLGG